MHRKTTEDIFKTPPANACNKCWQDKHGVYMSLPVFLTPEDSYKPHIPLCYKAFCPLCGDVKIYTLTADFPQAGVYRLSGDIPDFNLRFWPELKGIDFKGFIALMLQEPRRQYYAFEDLPALDSGHRAEFYEPKSAGLYA